MATVAGLNDKLIAAVKRIVTEAGAPELAKLVDETGESNAVYTQIEAAAAARYRLIKRFQSQPPSKEIIASVSEKLQELNTKQIEALRALHVRQLEKMGEELVGLGISEAEKHQILEGLKKAQKEQIEGMKAIAEEDRENLTDFHKKFNARMSAAMIIRHLGKEHDKDTAEKAKDMASQFMGTDSKPDLVQRFGIWNSISDLVMGSSETLRGWAKESKEGYEYEKWGGVEHRFARSFAMSDLVYEDGHWQHKEPDQKKRTDDKQWFMGAEPVGKGGRPARKKEEEDVWAINLQDNYFKSTNVHEYDTLGSAGALKPSSIPLKIVGAMFGCFGNKFTVKYDYLAPDEDRHLPGGPGLSMEAAGGGILSHSENIVRLGVLAHEAMARGWEGAELRRMAPELKDEAYLAFRRAGFAHEDIFYYGQLFSEELRRRGDIQRGVIEKAWGDKAPLDDIAALALNVPNPLIAPPAEFYAGQPNAILRQFNDLLTSRSQRAELLADAASYALDDNFAQQFQGNLTADQQKDVAAFLGELGILDSARALEVYNHLSRNQGPQPNSDIQFNVFQQLGALGANDGIRSFLVSVIMSEDLRAPVVDDSQAALDARKSALFAAIGSDTPRKLRNKAHLLLDETLSPVVAAKLFNSIPDADAKAVLLKELVDITTTYDADKLGRLLVGIYKNPPPGAGADSKWMMDIFDQVNDQMPFLHRGPRLEALKEAFINHPELTFDERKQFLNGLRDTLDPLNVIKASYREYMSLMTVENAFFYLKDKYGANFKDEFTKTPPFFREAVDEDRLIKFAEMYERTFGEDPDLAQGQNPFTSPDVPRAPARILNDAWVVQHIDTVIDDYNGPEHVAAYFNEPNLAGPQLINHQLQTLAQIQDPVHQAKILRRLPEAALDVVISRANQTHSIIYALLSIQQNAIGGLSADMPERQRDAKVAELLAAEAGDMQKVARSILRLPPNEQAAVLAHLATAADDAPKQKAFYKLLKSLGARTVAQAIKFGHNVNHAEIFTALQNLARVAKPNPLLVAEDPDNVKFLAKVLTACHLYRQNGQPDALVADISTVQLSKELRAKILAHTNQKGVIEALMIGALTGVPDNAKTEALKDIVLSMEKNADKAKVFGGIPENRQQAVLDLLLDEKTKAVVFRAAHPNIQRAYLRTLTGPNDQVDAMTKESANQVLRLISPSTSADRNLFDLLSHEQKDAVLSKATVMRSVFLHSLWQNNFATLANIMTVDRFNHVPEANQQRANAIDDYMLTVARAGLMLTGDGNPAPAKAFFLKDDLNGLGNGVRVRAQMLMLLVDSNEKAKAKDYFDSLTGEQKDHLKNHVGTKYNAAEFNALRGIVGLARVATPQQQANNGPPRR